MKHKRTKTLYVKLFSEPKALFPPSADSDGVETILFPDGRNEIWFRDSAGNGFRLTAGRGPAGIALHVSRFVGGTDLAISGNREADYQTFALDMVKEISICQYDRNKWADEFKAWYMGDHGDPSRPAHPGPKISDDASEEDEAIEWLNRQCYDDTRFELVDGDLVLVGDEEED